MTRRRNPFRIIRITAATIGSIALVGLFGWLIVMAVIIAVGDDPNILWQAPLAIVVLTGVVVLTAFGCSAIAHGWRKLEHHYDRKDAPSPSTTTNLGVKNERF